MKKFITIIIIMSSTIFVYGEKTDDIKKKLETYEIKLNHLDSIINSNDTTIINLSRELKEKENLFHLYNILLEKYENSRSSLISEFSILIGVLSLMFGIVGYFTVLKPAQESKKEVDRLLEKLHSNIDELFSEYLKKNRDKLINRYLQIILDKKEDEISNAIHYLDSVKHEGFNSEQLFKMRKIVLEEEFEYTHQIFSDMIFTKDEIVENTCKEIVVKKIDSVVAYALIYFAQHNIHKYDDLIINYMNQNPDKWGTIISSIRSASEDYLIDLWNNFYDSLNEDSMTNISNTLKYYKSEIEKNRSLQTFIEKVKKTEFAEKNKDDKLRFLFTYMKSLF